MKKKATRACRKQEPIVRGMIPSQNAMRFCAAVLRRLEATAKRDAIVCIYANEEAGAHSLRLQADDCRQVATFLEERIIDQPFANIGICLKNPPNPLETNKPESADKDGKG